MSVYDFKLAPAFCLYNGVAVMKQEGSKIWFLTENIDNDLLKERMKKAFENYLSYILRQKDCPAVFCEAPRVEFVKGSRQELRKYVSKLYTQKDSMNKEVGKKDSAAVENEAAAVVLLDAILLEARNRNATDIHIEKNVVKFRIFGRLEKYSLIDSDKCKELIQRVKYLAGMNVLEKRRSQDGHFIYGTEKPFFARVSSMAVIGNGGFDYDESVVIRLLDTSRIPLSLGNLGFDDFQYSAVKKLCGLKSGLIIVCGPTGAGKSTTAASILLEIEKIKNGAVKIISLEDPPEYLIPGVTQIQIDERIDNSFSDALSHVFRQDPDVLMIGEIRDENSAEVAVRAALTGHLVIATLHTGSAGGAVLRLEDLGISKKLFGSVLQGIIVQDLNENNKEVNLLADVSIPLENFGGKIMNENTEEQMEKCFEHFTNFAQVLAKTIHKAADEKKNGGNKNHQSSLLFLPTGTELSERKRKA